MKKKLSHFEKPSFFHFITEKCIFYLKYTLNAIKIMIDKKLYNVDIKDHFLYFDFCVTKNVILLLLSAES